MDFGGLWTIGSSVVIKVAVWCDNGVGYESARIGSIWGISVPFSQFCCEP